MVCLCVPLIFVSMVTALSGLCVGWMERGRKKYEEENRTHGFEEWTGKSKTMWRKGIQLNFLKVGNIVKKIYDT